MDKTKELLVIDGGTVKSEENGIVKGLAIVFGSPKEPDQSQLRDFFTADSFIMKKNKFDVPLYYNHGFPVKEQIGEATLTKTDAGWETTATLDLTNDLAKTVYENAKSKQYGFSTGALTHLVEREAKDNNTNFLKRWVVGELSITERPAERKAIVQAIKSLDGEVTYEDAFDEESKSQDEMDGSIVVAVYDEEGNKLWDIDDDIKNLEGKTPKKIEIKSTSGSVSYDLYHYDEESGVGTEMMAYQWGGTGDFIEKMRTMLDAAAQAVKSKTDEELTLEEKIEKIVKSKLSDEKDSAQVSELKSQLQDAKDELASAEQKAADSETNLTEAKKRIAQLEILAGASEIIKTKGK